jgi:AAA+ ATPase superfamily predicted ATPase
VIGRVEELKALETFYKSEESNVMVVYGRRGIGKTTLLRNFTEDKQVVFFTLYSTTERQQRTLMARKLGLIEDGQGEESAPDLEAIFERIAEMSTEGIVVLVLDQYPNYAKTDEDFPRKLHDYMATKWNKGRVKLILCGDSYLHMEKLAWGKKAIWRDFMPQKMELAPLDYYDTRELCGLTDVIECARLYGITGGIPALVEKASAIYEHAESKEDAEWELIRQIYLTGDFSYRGSAESILETELREKTYYDRLLYALANGNNRVNQLSVELGKPKDVVVPYLNTLMSLGLVTKENPVTEPTNRRKTRYSIVSETDRLWYQILVPQILSVYDKDFERVKAYWEAQRDVYMKDVFIRICKEYLIRSDRDKALPFSIKSMGNWWENDEENGTSEDFDLMASGETEGKDAYIFGRCFWGDDAVNMADVKGLIDLTRKVHDKSATFYLFFSRNGFEENVKTVSQTIRNIMLIDLKDMIKE